MNTVAKTKKTMRLCNQTIAMVEKENGENFTEKFESLVLNSFQKKLGLEKQIDEAEKRLKKLNKDIQQFKKIEQKLKAIENFLSYAQNETNNRFLGWEN